MCRDGYNVKLWDRNGDDVGGELIFELQTKDVDEFCSMFKTLDSLLKMFEKRKIELYDSPEETKNEKEI